MSAARKNGSPAEGRDARGKFTSGNPGRRLGSKNRTTRAAETLLEGRARDLTEKAIAVAMEGDPAALRLVLERLIPAKRPGDRPIEITLPSEPGAALDTILQAVAAGELLPAEAERLASLVKARAELSAWSEIEQRLAALEARQ